MTPTTEVLDVAAAAPVPKKIAFPAGLAPALVPVDPNRKPNAELPLSDVVVITWTVDALAGLATVFCPGRSAAEWPRYTHRYATIASRIRPGAPAANSKRLASPVINGDLPSKEFPLDEQTTWAVGYYTAYGEWTSVSGALATWGIIAGLV